LPVHGSRSLVGRNRGKNEGREGSSDLGRGVGRRCPAACGGGAGAAGAGGGARVRLVVGGSGPLRDRVDNVLAAAGLRDRAWLPGDHADVPDLLRGLNCFVLPSLAEGVSNTILEAMASGIPIVATRVGGNPELIDDGVTGRLVPATNAETMATAILGYFDDPTLGRRHGRA